MYEVTDDSGFLALAVPASYRTFVSSDFTFERVRAHFRAQMARRSLLIWGTGLEGFWNVDVALKSVDVSGFREVSGPIRVTGGSLLLTNYDSLTMAAQYEDVTLPEKHQRDLLLALSDGEYTCRIIQMFNPARETSAGENKPDFVIEVQTAAGQLAVWDDIPWLQE
jgi:hypothetical protein